MLWYLTNSSSFRRDVFITNIYDSFEMKNDFFVFLDGYIIPRLNVFEENKHIFQTDLVRVLYDKYGLDFIKYIKGIFVLIIIKGNNFFIFNDRHSIKKYFIFEENGVFYISNSLKKISDSFRLSLNKENIALFSLTSHFLNGETMFKNVTVCRPAEIVEFNQGRLSRSFYWHPKEILKNRRIINKTISDFALEWKKIVNDYISYIFPKDIALTLTGGNDSRMIMSALLSSKAKFHTFTFGNPLSQDCVVSKVVSDKSQLAHKNYFVHTPSKEWFHFQAQRIIQFGNGFVNIHRAHRNDAISNEIIHFPMTEMLFTGLMGGEYFKEPSYNDIVIPILFKTLKEDKSYQINLKTIKNMLHKKGIIVKNINADSILKKIEAFIEHGKDLNKTEAKFVYTYLFYGCSHHTQDSIIFGDKIKYVVNPFMDIDFLEMISCYNGWYLNRKRFFLHRAFHSEFLVAITDYLAPELSGIPYAKNGEYTASDLLHHKIKYILKRIHYYISKDKYQYPINFPIGEWLFRFCDVELEKLNGDILEIYNLEYLKRQLHRIKNEKNEGAWHIVTNPINVFLNYKYYENH